MDSRKAIRTFLVEKLAENGFHKELYDNDSLIEGGIVDSLNFLNLLSFLDEKFGIIPAKNELDPSNFDSINLIDKFVREKLNSNTQ